MHMCALQCGCRSAGAPHTWCTPACEHCRRQAVTVRCDAHLRMLPKAEKVSCSALLSTDLSRFLMKMLPTPVSRKGQQSAALSRERCLSGAASSRLHW